MTTGTGAQPKPPVELWYRDLISCLQSTLATVVIHAGHDPLEMLGACWEFLFKPGDVRSEEFYHPCRYPDDLGRSLAPYHGLSTRWREPRDLDDPLAELRANAAQGRLSVVAVDNFYLPFRPAFGDVHAAHLLVVYEVDDADDLVHVSDAMPPAFRGPIPTADFLRAWSSDNPRDVQDAFFSDTAIGRRRLAVDVGTEPFELDAARLRGVLDDNLAGFDRAHDPAGWNGLTGLDRFLEDLLRRSAAGEAAALEETYPFGWAMQAQASLHAELLRTWGLRHGSPAVREAGRLVESVAHAWTGLRMTAAHGRLDPTAATADLTRHARLLRIAYDTAVDGVRQTRETLSPEGNCG